MDLKDIKAIIDLMRKNSISEFEIERQDFKLKLKRGPNGGPMPVPAEEAPVAVYLPPAQMAPPMAGGPPGSLPASTATPEVDIKSPMIGTFYRATSPDSANYVEIGSEVNPDTIVCIIEAMKVMNEIKAEARGVITRVPAENGKPVEFGQPLFKIRPI